MRKLFKDFKKIDIFGQLIIALTLVGVLILVLSELFPGDSWDPILYTLGAIIAVSWIWGAFKS
jgi:hypothetical protein|tara:strand:+ start:44 stop:232 length:189 start_codon:yes stop_codon:yes gene_type:complete